MGTPLIYRSQPFGFTTAMLAGIPSPARRNDPQCGISAGLLTDGTAGDSLVAVDCQVPHPYVIQSQGRPMPKHDLDVATVGEIIEMALSDSASFASIKAVHGLNADEVRAVMRQALKPGSYRAWRKRVRQCSDRREIYK